ncbi:tRNA (adenine(22)-N(1))-methyltransferase TrmK [Neobacillus mesonae]|uniref:tRNA (adenine(22)-N(1))-methyltransferase n=1 Tax=Neobacillus mesonae TaxID=1193713 RepID=UPI00203BF69A|nr:tRNA (adenine(22)-N(1))-methyltransferase TrmK [Neobacillus mesonae]MCM3566587.1 tRNA (adenine(22)-N(1))-methyltransferase TrmK [Neobacillus mesonae]
MNTDKLSARLAAVAKYVPKGAKIADIGSDHAYLPCYLAKNSGISFAVAGEVAVGPFQSAERNVSSEGLSDMISVRLGDGLEVIQSGEVDHIAIAGMGGALIASILENGKEKLGSVKRLILQPNISAVSVRKWFLDNGWVLIAEEIIEEDGKIYEVLAAEKGSNPLKPYEQNVEAGLLFGPYLSKEKSKVFAKKWLNERNNWLRIYQQLEHAAQTPGTVEKKKELFTKIQLVEEVLGNEESKRS